MYYPELKQTMKFMISSVFAFDSTIRRKENTYIRVVGEINEKLNKVENSLSQAVNTKP